jgi:hypothetical protein
VTDAVLTATTADPAEAMRRICTTAAIVVASAVAEPANLTWGDGPTYITVERSWLTLLADDVEEFQPGYLDEIREGLEEMANPAALTCGVYFVRSGDAVKIGMSKDVPRRLRTLRTMSPLSLELLGVVPGGRDEEAQLHREWASLRLHGEWFRASPELIGRIAGLTSAARLAAGETTEVS